MSRKSARNRQPGHLQAGDVAVRQWRARRAAANHAQRLALGFVNRHHQRAHRKNPLDFPKIEVNR